MLDYYKILGVEKTISCNDVRQVFSHLAHRYHPDKSGDSSSAAKFIQVYEAYRVLSHVELRAKYDETFNPDSSDEFSIDLSNIRLDGERIVKSSIRLHWVIVVIIIGELMLWNRKLSIASLALTAIGLATFIRGLINSTTVDLWIGAVLASVGVFLGLIAARMLKKEYQDLSE